MNDNPHESQDGVSDTPERTKQSKFTLLHLFTIFGILLLLVALMLPAVRTAGPAARRTQCKNNLKQIALALHNYAEIYDAFPPAYTVDADGKPLHSWRTLIPPFLDQAPLYETIDLSKPWNDPANSDAYKIELSIYKCPSAVLPPNHTSYLSVVASNSFFRPTESRRLSEVTDNHGETIMVIEVASEHAVHWMAPQDADERIVLGVGPETKLPHEGGVHALFVDGSVKFISSETTTAVRRALISIAGNDGAVTGGRHCL